MKLLLKNISLLAGTQRPPKPLRGKELGVLPVIRNAWLLVEGDSIAGFGPMEECPTEASAECTDATGCLVLPGWCDSHSHIVFAGSRENEFIDKINGLTYEEIAARGGGILHSANQLRELSEEALYRQSIHRVRQVAEMGTTALEIKSGYGLNTDAELKMLRVIQRIKKESGLLIRSTFLGAHAFPAEFKNDHEGYIQFLIEDLLPKVAAEKLADYIDVFCERGFFDTRQSARILEAGKRVGLKPKIHANQLHPSGGVQVGVEAGALSVDHLESMDDEAIRVLSESDTLGTLLPTAAFFLRMPYPPARKLIAHDCLLALASDYNPGSSPSGNMNLVVSLACIQMKMLPEEAINAATINGAFAMELGEVAGSIAVGKKANLILTQSLPSLAFLPYDFGNNHIKNVMVAGTWIK